MHILVGRLLAKISRAQVDEQVGSGFRLVLKEATAVVDKVLLACLRSQGTEVPKGIFILLSIFDLDAQVVLVTTILSRQVRSVLEEAGLTTNADRGVEVERQPVSAGIPLCLVLDESIEAGTV